MEINQLFLVSRPKQTSVKFKGEWVIFNSSWTDIKTVDSSRLLIKILIKNKYQFVEKVRIHLIIIQTKILTLHLMVLCLEPVISQSKNQKITLHNIRINKEPAIFHNLLRLKKWNLIMVITQVSSNKNSNQWTVNWSVGINNDNIRIICIWKKVWFLGIHM